MKFTDEHLQHLAYLARVEISKKYPHLYGDADQVVNSGGFWGEYLEAVKVVAENAAALVTAELQQPNVARFMANESLTKRNAELEAENAKLRAACEAAQEKECERSCDDEDVMPGENRHTYLCKQLRAALEGK